MRQLVNADVWLASRQEIIAALSFIFLVLLCLRSEKKRKAIQNFNIRVLCYMIGYRFSWKSLI